MSGIGSSKTLTILIERQPNREYAAIDEANHDLGWPVGYGKTKRAAIDDLIDQMDERPDRRSSCGVIHRYQLPAAFRTAVA
jgi:hypothetical protein